MNLSKNKIKYLNSFKQKKQRDTSELFLAEGEKLVLDLLLVLPCHTIIATNQWVNINKPSCEEIIAIDHIEELKKISSLNTPPQVIALFYKVKQTQINDIDLNKDLILCLDQIQDPGNLGTIIRVADWFGIKHIVCSKNTVDLYNQKTIQSTMGAIARVKLIYVDLFEFISNCKKTKVPIYATTLDGENIYHSKFTPNGVIIMGNEGNGISAEIKEIITHKLFIPPYPSYASTSESLNVATATAIICSEFRRNIQ